MGRNFLKIILLLMGLLSLGATQAASPRDPYKFFFNETWGNFKEELANARAQGKQAVLFFFEMDECPFCHYMKNNVLNQPKVQEYFRKHFLAFPVDIEGDVDITTPAGEEMRQKDFAFKKHRVRATPVIVIYDLDGKVIYRHTGKTAGVEEFLWVGEFIVDGHYKKMRYQRFKRQKRKQQKGH